MNSNSVILCGALNAETLGLSPHLELNTWPTAGKTNVRLDILDLNQKFCTTVNDRFYDLLDIATYVFEGDQMFCRGNLDVDTFGNKWRRNLHYHIPVRDLDFWKDAKVGTLLSKVLHFLSDDSYSFTFYSGKGAPNVQDYFKFGEDASGMRPPEKVMLFSGGLDSLGGAVEEIVMNNHHVALVNHQSTDKFCRTYNELMKQFNSRCGHFQPTHVRIEINKKGFSSKDYNQRARSFLYMALGGTVAQMLGLSEVSFYENGVLSLNLPICGQIVGARSTRTTHPRVIAGYRELLTLMSGKQFEVSTPFLWKTKGEVVKRIIEGGCEDLIQVSRSCAHTWQTNNNKPHCGVCSQCLDRRIGVLVADADEYDPLDRYQIDIFTQERPKEEDKILGAGFIERANQIEAMQDSSGFLSQYPELARAIPYTEKNPDAALEQFFKLYKRHSAEVKKALKKLLGIHAISLIERTLPGECLIRSVTESGAVTSTTAAPKDDNNAVKEPIVTLGKLKYRPGFGDLWIDDDHFDLRTRDKARCCIQYLVEKQAFDAESAKHLKNEIDPYVRKNAGDLPPAADLRIDHYFNESRGRLKKLRDLIKAAGRNGRFFLRIE